MPTRQSPTVRLLPDRPDLAQLKRQAKELRKAFAAGDAQAVAEVDTHYRRPDAATFTLHEAQLVIARAYGFPSWPKLKAYVDGVTVHRLVDAIQSGDVDAVTSMLSVRPELVTLDVSEGDEHRALHHAVLRRQPEIVRLLMQFGADARKGIWPHRDATSPLTLALERGDTEIVGIIREEEARRAGVSTAVLQESVTPELADAFRRGDEPTLIRLFDATPSLVQASDPGDAMTALHWAAAALWSRFAEWLLDRGASPSARTSSGRTPLDLLGTESAADSRRQSLAEGIGRMLLRHGAEPTARWAVIAGDADWLRSRHTAGALAGETGLVSLAVSWRRPDILRLLLELDFDPDERARLSGIEETVLSWGGPLRECARSGDSDMAEILLDRGADPNTNVYAASSAMYEAYARQHWTMVGLLQRHGGVVNATTAGYLGLVDEARRLLDDEAEGRLEGAAPTRRVAEALLESAADGGHVDLVRLALDRLDWPPGDSRWPWMLMRPFGRHTAADRDRYVACFRMIVDRSGVDLPERFGRTLLHDVAAAWPRTAPMSSDDRLAFATILLDRGARLDVRDHLLKSTPLGWACRWGQVELVRLLLERGADPVEADAEPWAAPSAWAEKMNHRTVLAELRKQQAGRSS